MKKRLILSILLVGYCALLIKIMVFKDVPLIRIGSLMLNFGGTNSDNPPNFIPFKTILPYLLGDKGLIIAGINLVGNIALLVPLGFLVPLVWQKISWKKTLALAVATGLIIEGMQVLLRVGIFDIDDVILNALGVMIGYWAYVLLATWFHSKNYKNIFISAVAAGSIIALSFILLFNDINQQPKNTKVDAGEQLSEPVKNKNEEVQESDDLCGGTGGTGQIISKQKGSITIKRNDGVTQDIIINQQTTIESSEGPATESDLKIGDRVTLVINDTKTASVVLLCSSS